MTPDPLNGEADLRRGKRRRDANASRAVTVDRLPPNSIEAEQGVLGCIFLDPYEVIFDCITALPDGPVTFYDLRHQVIYELLVGMADAMEPIDTITVQQKLKDRQQLEAVGGVAYLASLPDLVPSAANISYYIGIVKEKHALRKMIRAATEIVTQVYEYSGDDVDELTDKMEAEFLASTQRQNSKIAVQCRPAVLRAIGRIESYSRSNGALTGISYGFIDIDKMTGGMKGGEMIIIAARPSVGKSSIAMNIAESVSADRKLPVAVFSLEMTEDQLIERCICSRARVNIRNVREGFFSERDYPRLALAAGTIGAAPLYIDDTGALSIMDLRARARRLKQQYGIKLFIIDYVQLLHSTSKRAQNRQQEIGDVSRGCKALAKELDVPVIVLAQLNRDLEKDKNRKPRLSDLRESGDLEADADIVGLLYRPSTDDDDNGYEREAYPVNLLIAKSRSGPTGEVYLTFIQSYTRFESAAKISADDVPPDGSQASMI